MISHENKQGRHYDVVIIGAGPAGTAAGLTLLKAQGLSVAIVEKTDFSDQRIGESLTPGVRPLLEYLDVWKQFKTEQSLESFGSQAAWGSSSISSLDYMFTLHGSGWSLNRVRFDKMLATTFINRGGHLLTETDFVKCELSADDSWRVQLSDSNIIRCHYLIDATGRKGRVAHALGTNRVIHDRLVGVSCIAQLAEKTVSELAIQIEACEYGWWYTTPVPGNKMAAVLISDADIISKKQAVKKDAWLSLLKQTAITSSRLKGAHFTENPQIFSCLSSCLEEAGGKRWIAVGDAVASHDPLSSSGIPHAIGSGVNGALVAANALLAKRDLLATYQQAIHADFNQYLTTHWQYYQREQRWSDALFWKRRTKLISINPHAKIVSVAPSLKKNSDNFVHLSHQLSSQLHKICQPGNSVHQVIRLFSDNHPHIPDQKIILQFQALVNKGDIKIEEHVA